MADDERVTFSPQGSFRRAMPSDHAQRAEPFTYKRLGRFMPRRYSRLTLIVTGVRVERLQNCSRDDAIAEGVERAGGGMLRWEWWSGAEGQSGTSPEAAYALLWNSINGPGAWESNPWVVAVSFDVQRGKIGTPASKTQAAEVGL